MKKDAKYNRIRRMGVGGREPALVSRETPPGVSAADSSSVSAKAGPDEIPEAPVVAAVPVLRANDREVVRFLQTATVTALRVLSEASVAPDVSEYLGDHIKPYLDAANWELSKLRGLE